MNALPKRTRLPGGPWIRVKEVSRHDIAVACGKDVAGFWDHGNMAIWVDRTLPIAEKWRVFAHELWFHAAIDLYDQIGVEFKPWE